MSKLELGPSDAYEGINRLSNVICTGLMKVPGVNKVDLADALHARYHEDAMIHVYFTNGQTMRILVDYKSLVTPNRVETLIRKYQPENDEYYRSSRECGTTTCDAEEVALWLVGSPKLSPAVQKRLQAAGLSYADLAGNLMLRSDRLLVIIEGKIIKFKNNEKRTDLFKRSSVKSRYVLRMLLEQPERTWLLKDLAKESEVSIGQAHKVLKVLMDKEYAIHTPSGYHLNYPALLFKEWSNEINTTPAQKTEYYAMASISEIEQVVEKYALKHNVLFAFTGLSGAARIAPTVRYNRVHIYYSGDLSNLAEQNGWKTVSSGSNVTVNSVLDAQLLTLKHRYSEKHVVPVSQLILDLYSLAGRGEEAAESILKEVYGYNGG